MPPGSKGIAGRLWEKANDVNYKFAPVTKILSTAHTIRGAVGSLPANAFVSNTLHSVGASDGFSSWGGMAAGAIVVSAGVGSSVTNAIKQSGGLRAVIRGGLGVRSNEKRLHNHRQAGYDRVQKFGAYATEYNDGVQSYRNGFVLNPEWSEARKRGFGDACDIEGNCRPDEFRAWCQGANTADPATPENEYSESLGTPKWVTSLTAAPNAPPTAADDQVGQDVEVLDVTSEISDPDAPGDAKHGEVEADVGASAVKDADSEVDAVGTGPGHVEADKEGPVEEMHVDGITDADTGSTEPAFEGEHATESPDAKAQTEAEAESATGLADADVVHAEAQADDDSGSEADGEGTDAQSDIEAGAETNQADTDATAGSAAGDGGADHEGAADVASPDASDDMIRQDAETDSDTSDASPDLADREASVDTGPREPDSNGGPSADLDEPSSTDTAGPQPNLGSSKRGPAPKQPEPEEDADMDLDW